MTTINHMELMFPEHTGFIAKWKLNSNELELCTEHFLRHWTEVELLEALWYESFPCISIHGKVYKVCWQVSPAIAGKLTYLAAKARSSELTAQDKLPMYWLSFRAGIDLDGSEFAYVIVQEDDKNAR